MIPFLPSDGGNCQDASILVEFFAMREKLSGAFEGTVIEKGITLHTKINPTVKYIELFNRTRLTVT